MANLEEISEKRPAGRPRCDRTRQAIMTAAYALLLERGLAGFSIEGVAARAGAAKTTIYRWWPSKGALAVEAFLAAMEPVLPFPDTGSPIADLKVQLHAFVRALNGPDGQILADLIAEGQTHPGTMKAFIAGYLVPRRQYVRSHMAGGIASGAIRPDIDLDIALDALFGAIAGRALLWGRPLDEAWVDKLVDTVLHGILAPRPAGAPAAA